MRTAAGHMAGFWLRITRVFFVICQLIITVITAQRCGMESSLYGKMLRDHTYKTVDTGNPLDCIHQCIGDDKCQSVNYVLSTGQCELNDRTKEARPVDFVPNHDRLYMTRWVKRGEWKTNCACVTARGCLQSRSQVLLSLQNGGETLGNSRWRVPVQGGRLSIGYWLSRDQRDLKLFTDDTLRCSSVNSAFDWLSNDCVYVTCRWPEPFRGLFENLFPSRIRNLEIQDLEISLINKEG